MIPIKDNYKGGCVIKHNHATIKFLTELQEAINKLHDTVVGQMRFNIDT